MNFYNKVLSFFEKKDNSTKFEKYLEVRNEYLILKKTIEFKKKKNSITERELEKQEKKLKELLKKKWYWEKRLVDVTKGLFIGVGVDLKLVKEVVAIYLDWKKLVNHYFVYGTSQVGKSRLLANHVRQMIMNNWNVIVVDPKEEKDKKFYHG